MDDYIKREDALSTFSNAFYAGLAAKINAIPSADVVQVVRCKDCVKRGKNCLSGKISLYDDGFCSDGERKDNETI